MRMIVWLTNETTNSAEAKDAARAYQNLEASLLKTQGEMEDIQLMHYVPGQCRLCKKLGAQ